MKKAHQVSRTVIDAIGVSERLKDEVLEHERTRAALQLMAQQDSLTGLANRTLFSDRFKPVNDTFGHASGDHLLKSVAERIVHCVRDSDTVERVGADEFDVLLREVDGAKSAMRVAEKIRLALSESFDIDGKTIEIGCSIGVAIYPDHGQTESELSRQADAAMYRAKHAGRNRSPGRPGLIFLSTPGA
jgi:diguanylate cyclase (GGDEF)-like protein